MNRAIVMIAVLAALAGSGSAQAATFGNHTDFVLGFEGEPGEANRPRIGFAPGVIHATDASATLRAGPKCTMDPDVAGRVVCPSAGIIMVRVLLGDGDDVLSVPGGVGANLPSGVKLHVHGHEGRDTIYGTKGADIIDGDLMPTRGAPDTIYGAGGKDRIRGMAGADKIYAQGSIEGGPGNDFISLFVRGFRVPSVVLAEAGNDAVIAGNKARDRINCGAGRDRATSTDNTARRKLDRYTSTCEQTF